MLCFRLAHPPAHVRVRDGKRPAGSAGRVMRLAVVARRADPQGVDLRPERRLELGEHPIVCLDRLRGEDRQELAGLPVLQTRCKASSPRRGAPRTGGSAPRHRARTSVPPCGSPARSPGRGSSPIDRAWSRPRPSRCSPPLHRRRRREPAAAWHCASRARSAPRSASGKSPRCPTSASIRSSVRLASSKRWPFISCVSRPPSDWSSIRSGHGDLRLRHELLEAVGLCASARRSASPRRG